MIWDYFYLNHFRKKGIVASVVFVAPMGLCRACQIVRVGGAFCCRDHCGPIRSPQSLVCAHVCMCVLVVCAYMWHGYVCV